MRTPLVKRLRQRISELSEKQKRFAVLGALLLIVLVIMIPVGVERLQYHNTQPKKIISLEYVKYEGELFNSVVLERRHTEDSALLAAFEKALQDSNVRPYSKQKDVHEILIIRTEQKTFYAYVQNGLLGLNYGQVKLQVPNLEFLLQQLPPIQLTTKQK